MIDGIPVNDMENGWVYWSNWSGLDAVTSNNWQKITTRLNSYKPEISSLYENG